MSGPADIVDQHVDPAEAIEARLRHCFNGSGAGDVALVGDDLAAARLFHAFDGFSDAIEIAIDRKNSRTFLGKTHRGGAPIAPTGSVSPGARHDGDPSLQAAAPACALAAACG